MVSKAPAWYVAAPHLQLYFAQSGRTSPAGTLQDHRAEAQVLACKRGALPGLQRRGDAAAHCGRHARSALVHEKFRHCVCVCTCE